MSAKYNHAHIFLLKWSSAIKLSGKLCCLACNRQTILISRSLKNCFYIIKPQSSRQTLSYNLDDAYIAYFIPRLGRYDGNVVFMQHEDHENAISSSTLEFLPIFSYVSKVYMTHSHSNTMIDTIEARFQKIGYFKRHSGV